MTPISILLLISIALILINSIQDIRNKVFLTYTQTAFLMLVIISVSIITVVTSTSVLEIICTALATCIWGYNLYTLQTSKLGETLV